MRARLEAGETKGRWGGSGRGWRGRRAGLCTIDINDDKEEEGDDISINSMLQIVDMSFVHLHQAIKTWEAQRVRER